MPVGAGLAAAGALGAVGGIVANIALTPLTSGAGLLQSYWYGAGLILGERMMYTVHWEQIKKRLDDGASFNSVLEEQMNDDITAIANLAFKAMDDTATIFRTQASVSIGAFMEELIQAALDPFYSGSRDPTGETPSEPIPETQTEPTHPFQDDAYLESVDIAILAVMRNEALHGLYTEAQKATILRIYNERSGTILTPEEEENISLRNDFRLQETEYLQTLSQVTVLARYWDTYLPAQSDGGTIIIEFLRIWNMATATQPRTQSSSSDQLLTTYRNRLSSARSIFISDPNENNQQQINLLHELIWLHQLVYSR